MSRRIQTIIILVSIMTTGCMTTAMHQSDSAEDEAYWRERVGQIEEGMTRDQVEAILGPVKYEGGAAGSFGEQHWLIIDMLRLSPHFGVNIEYIVPAPATIQEPLILDESQAHVYQKPKLLYENPRLRHHTRTADSIFDDTDMIDEMDDDADGLDDSQ